MKIRELLYETDITNAIPYKQVEQIKKLVKKGANDEEHKWSNALDLVHRAYEASSVQRPMPSMEDAWGQYEEIIEFAVKELQKATDKGIRDDSWKSMSVELEKSASK